MCSKEKKPEMRCLRDAEEAGLAREQEEAGAEGAAPLEGRLRHLPTGSKAFAGPTLTVPGLSLASGSPWPPVIPRRLPPSQMFKAGGVVALGLVPWGAPASGGGNHFLPALQGVPWRWRGRCCTNRKPQWGRAEGCADTSWLAGLAGNSHGDFPWTLGGHRPVPPPAAVALNLRAWAQLRVIAQ